MVYFNMCGFFFFFFVPFVDNFSIRCPTPIFECNTFDERILNPVGALGKIIVPFFRCSFLKNYEKKWRFLNLLAIKVF